MHCYWGMCQGDWLITGGEPHGKMDFTCQIGPWTLFTINMYWLIYFVDGLVEFLFEGLFSLICSS